MTTSATKPRKATNGTAATNAADILVKAKALAKKHRDSVSLSNAVFGPDSGLLAEQLITPEQRASFTKSREYREITKLIDSLPLPPAEQGPLPTASGVFNLRLPKSLHEALQQEAEREGVSLNQLCVAKLSGALGRIIGRQAG